MPGKKKRWNPTDEQVVEAGKLYALGLNHARVAAFFGVSESTFDRAIKKNAALRDAMQKSAASLIAQVSRTAFEMATSKQSPALTIFWLKCKGGWKEKNYMEVESKGGLLNDPAAATAKADALLTEFKGLLAELKQDKDGDTE